MESRAPWYKRSFRRNLVDMHINDTDDRFLSQLDARTYVDLLAQARVDTAILYASSCLGICYWPTQIGHMHRGLKGRDWVAEILAACRAKGIRPVLYVNFWSKWAYENHPDWRMVSIDGKGTLDYLWQKGRYGVCCLNSPYRDFFISLIEELCSRYEADGLWVDMIGWIPGVCYCGHCRRRYFEERGREIPTRVDWTDPEWVEFQRRREAWKAEFAEAITRKVKSIRPHMSVAHQTAAWTLGWYAGFSQRFLRQSDYLAGDFYSDALEQSVTCKVLNNLTEDRPIEFMTSRCPNLTHHTTRKPPELLASQAFSALAHQASFLFIDAIDPVGTLDPGVYEEMGRIYREIERFEPHLDPDADMIADVAIYFNFESMIDLEQNQSPVPTSARLAPPVPRMRAIAKALIHGNILYDVVTDRNLDALNRYQVVIVPDLPVLSDREVEAFAAFVESGGSLFVSGASGALKPDGLRRGPSPLDDLLGVVRHGRTEETVTYVAPVPGTPGADILAPYTPKHPLMLTGPQFKVEAASGAEVWATITLPYTNPSDPTAMASAISNPPGVPTDWPAIVVRRRGRGRTVYTAGNIQDVAEDAHRTTLVRLVRALLSRPAALESDAPKPVEFTLFRRKNKKRFLLCALNYQAEQPNLPVYGISVSLRLEEGGPWRLVQLPGGEPVSCTERGGRLLFTLERLDTFAMFAVEPV